MPKIDAETVLTLVKIRRLSIDAMGTSDPHLNAISMVELDRFMARMRAGK